MPLSLGVLRETSSGESRVALSPDGVARLLALGVATLVESGAGQDAWFPDGEYAAAGAIVTAREQVQAEADILVCVRPPATAAGLREGQVLVGLLQPLTNPALVKQLAQAKVTAISLDMLPRTLSRAQAMDALTSQANVAGYKAALVAADAYGGYFPMLITAAGTTRPAQVLVVGAGVAGLQAIATARRLGALVTGYDVREAAHADITSMGAAVLDLSSASASAAGGYARALTEQEAAAQQEALAAAVGRFDVIITTAQVPGRRPPLLVTAAAVAALRPGSVIVDLAAGPLGGNVEGSAPGTTTTGGGVTIIGAPNLPAAVPRAASVAYSRNVAALLGHFVHDGAFALPADDEISAAVVITHDGDIVQPTVRRQEGAP
jgi:NAD(P) transhydrogenase subunit alpha